MLLLILGLVLLLGAHTFTTRRAARAAAVERLGEGPYKGLYSLVSLLGLALIVYGFRTYREAGYIQVWDPPTGMRHLTLLLMWPAMICLVAAYVPGSIKRVLKHPMLVAVKIWAFAHLLANGDLGSMVLFGSVLAWAVYDRISLKRREQAGEVKIRYGGRLNDVVAVVLGTVLYAVMIFLHPILIGVPVVAF
ncbi:NnrU family protein [Alsobacter soli]|uniref:NnrU family protein n=1 Tax=Alsobacter soli TaxID=2109933 RepID=A0A2T1HXZ6_9HYPH|nr:NnrU family protein [Alsobacter soli]PSC06369.1 NnrU family protein [Alsobacter soli]